MEMIKFKLCKQFNTVEIEYESLSEINTDQLDAIYAILPDYIGPVVETKEKPTDAQLKFAKQLGIDTTGMSKEEVRVAIQKITKKS